MKKPRDRVSIAEVQETDADLLNKIFEDYDVSPGEFFFIKSDPVKEYLVEDVVANSEEIVIYDSGKQIEYYEKCIPLYSVGSMIEHIENCGERIDFRSFDQGWLIILGNSEIITSDEGEDLVAFLWRAVKRVAEVA